MCVIDSAAAINGRSKMDVLLETDVSTPGSR